MSQPTRIGRVLKTGHAPPHRTRKWAARLGRQQSSPRCSLRVEQLENRLTPSLNPATPFELDGNVTPPAPTHDWDQVFNPAQFGPSGALATAFVTDQVNSTADDIFQGGGSKDTLGIQSGQWL